MTEPFGFSLKSIAFIIFVRRPFGQAAESRFLAHHTRKLPTRAFLYRHDYYMQHGPVQNAWFRITDATFGLILVVKFLIKIVAEGFLFTPNAYIRSIWNVLFMTLINKMRSTFEDLILAGFIHVLDAAVLAILDLIPFSVWGTTIFARLVNECNDTSVQGIGDCSNEYVNMIYGNNFGFLVPHAWDNPVPSTKFSFDNFPASMLILFEIVSLEGWIDVMSVAMSITGRGQQPQINVLQANAIFFVIYNLLGAVMILMVVVR